MIKQDITNKANELKELMKSKYIWTKVKDSNSITREVRVDEIYADRGLFDASYRSFAGSFHIFLDLPIEKYNFYTS